MEPFEIGDEYTTETIEWTDEDWCVSVFVGLGAKEAPLEMFLDDEHKVRKFRSLGVYDTIQYKVYYQKNDGFYFKILYNYRREESDHSHIEEL